VVQRLLPRESAAELCRSLAEEEAIEVIIANIEVVGIAAFYLNNLAQETVTRTIEFEDGQRKEYNVGERQYVLIT